MPAIINSDDGVLSGSSGLKTSGGNDGILALQNNGTTNVTVTAAGNVGIGTNSPTDRLTLFGGNQRIQKDVPDIRFRSSGDVNRWYIGANISDSVNGGLHFGSGDGIGGTLRAAIDSSGNFQFNSGYGSVAIAYGCRAWVNFNGTGTVAIRASGNVTSITDNGTGDYTVNFTTAMPDVNYSVIGTCNLNLTGNYNRVVSAPAFAAPTTSALRFATSPASTGTAEDQLYVFIAIFR